MHPIPLHEFTRRLEKWKANPTARLFAYTDRGKRVRDYWMEGRVYLRDVRSGRWAEIYGDRGVPRYQQRLDKQTIAFTYLPTYHDDGGPPVTARF